MNDKDRTLLRYVVEGDIRKAQQQAKIILEGITTAKDEQFKTRCLSQLSAKAPELIELPYNMQGLLVAEDVTNFPENRYLLRDSEKAVIERLLKTRKASLRLKELLTFAGRTGNRKDRTGTIYCIQSRFAFRIS